MEWTQLKQKDAFVENSMIANRLDGDFYQGNFITFGNILEGNAESNSDVEYEDKREADPNATAMLCWWNTSTNRLIYIMKHYF